MKNQNKKFYNTKWFMWLWLILFPPIGLILLWTCHKDMKKKTKIIMSVVFVIWFVILLAATSGDSTDLEKENQPVTEPVQNSELETESANDDELNILIEGGCRALTERFVEGVVGEDYSMFAFSVEDFELDENENGTINVLYLPSDAGNGATKVNLTISKNGGTYKIKSALLAGLYEVDLEEIPKEYTELITE